jgi:alpha-tubulin suppressor-like RCC1 family protein
VESRPYGPGGETGTKVARIDTRAPQHGRAQERVTSLRRRGFALASAFTAIALIALALAGVSSARVVRDAGARPLAESAPKVTQQPTNTTVAAGSPAKFLATGSGSPTPTEQWERSTDGGKTFQPIEGATSSSYNIAAAAPSENGYKFRAVFTNSAGTATTNVVTLTVQFKPEITLQPVETATPEGKEATFTSTAAGNPTPTVQWQESTDGGVTYKNVTGATATTLKLSGISKTMDGYKFHAVFTNSSGTATSEAATLHVENAPVLQQQPLEQTVLEGQQVEFKTSASGNPAPTVQWERSIDGGKTFQAIEGATSPTYTIASPTIAEDGYRFRATWTNVVSSATTTAATLNVRTLPKVTEQPQAQLVLTGGTVTFETQGTGHPTPTVQWELSTNGGSTFAPVGGATQDTLTVANAQTSENGHLYRAVFKNVAGTATSENALLTVSATDYGAYGWGPNKSGQAGTGSSEGFQTTPGALPGLGFVTQLAAGGKFGLALRANGTVASWGSNAHGQLGNEGAVGVHTPELIEHLSGVTQVAAGMNHSLAVLSNGTVMAWGDDEIGQLGNGKNTDSEVPLQVPGITGATAVAAGEGHSLALLSNGHVMAWGQGEDGQLGDNSRASRNTPVEVEGITEAVAIAAGGHDSLALLKNGTVMAWGDDLHFELGDEEVMAKGKPGVEEEEALLSTTPVPVNNLSNVKAISMGRDQALALLENGTVVSWGGDGKGQLGNGAIETRNDKPSPVPGLSGVTAIAAGEEFSAAVLSTGVVMTWGSNENAGLGIGSTGEPSDVPVQAHGIGQVIGVAAGGEALAFGEALPVVSKVTPHEGPMEGGATVTITGVNLGGVSAVHFGTAAAKSFTVESGGSITATTPAGTGTVDVTVTNSSGTSGTNNGDKYTYRTPPTVSKLSVKGGPANGGTTVTITGLGFTGATGVSFAGVPATGVVVNGNTSITAVSPVGVAGPADVRVTAVGGTSAAVKKDQFRYAPVIESVSPANGLKAGGNTVVITGFGFPEGTNTVKFKFGKATSKSVQCTSNTSCSVVAPLSKVTGTFDIIAQANKGKSTAVAGDRYTYE